MNVNVGKYFFNGRKAVTGTVSQLEAAASRHEARQGVQLLAEPANTATVYVGASGTGTGNGFPIDPTGSLFLPIDSTDSVWCISATGTQYLRFIGG